MPALTIYTTPAGPAWTSIILPPTTTSYTTSIILPPSGVPIPTVADTPSEATSAAAVAVTVGSVPSSTDATTVIVETDEAWEAELLEDMKVASIKRKQRKENKKRRGKKRCPPCAMM
ncbi:hypothetical protein J4E91_006290 [Alternaria rosae]|nr:hypothetical protein J4E91_006290 [Alternaria rosae]